MKKSNRSERKRYFRRQKIAGGVMAALGVLATIILGGDGTVALFLVPFGLYIMFTKEMVLMDDYYFEQNQKIERRESR